MNCPSRTPLSIRYVSAHRSGVYGSHISARASWADMHCSVISDSRADVHGSDTSESSGIKAGVHGSASDVYSPCTGVTKVYT